MSTTLYMDENVNRAITVGLRQRGVDVVTAQEDWRAGAPDDEILSRSTELGRALFSQDDDLLRVAKQCQVEGIPFSGVIYAHQLRITIGESIRDLELVAEAGQPQELADSVLHLPL
ncbi:MAG: hypothetical protein GY719_04395 [bacterium]|nr:hypothetical protein [bacterium]